MKTEVFFISFTIKVTDVEKSHQLKEIKVQFNFLFSTLPTVECTTLGRHTPHFENHWCRS